VHIGKIEVPGIDPTQVPEAVRLESLENGVEFLKAAAGFAEDAGVVLGVENLLHRPGDVLLSYQELVDVVEASGSQAVGITLDTGHAELTDGLDEAVAAFGSHLRHLHVHDCVDGEDHHEVGLGSLDLGRYTEALRRVPFTMALEVGTSAVLALESGEDPIEMVLRSVAAVKTMLGDLAE
jgi:sugar phosphate isomerase/epimerase